MFQEGRLYDKIRLSFLALSFTFLPLFHIAALAAPVQPRSEITPALPDTLDSIVRVTIEYDVPIQSYGLIFHDRFLLTTLNLTTPENNSLLKEELRNYLTIETIDSPGKTKSTGVQFVRLQAATADSTFVVAEIKELIEGLTPVTLPFEQGITSFRNGLKHLQATP